MDEDLSKRWSMLTAGQQAELLVNPSGVVPAHLVARVKQVGLFGPGFRIDKTGGFLLPRPVVRFLGQIKTGRS